MFEAYNEKQNEMTGFIDEISENKLQDFRYKNAFYSKCNNLRKQKPELVV
ncbi:MAG: hypothetical protein FWE93_01145 [Alphaproteobacteria bacterium]|nr:hypothetical protein [Alphaproteobacteria bacterium]